MDNFHAVLVESKNRQAPGLVDICKARHKKSRRRIKAMSIPVPLLDWCRRMDLAASKITGRDYLVYGHQPVNHITALLCARYGLDETKWPKAFSHEDLVRALAWEGGKIPSYVRWGEARYYPIIAGGSEFTNYMETEVGNGLFRSDNAALAVWTASATKTVGSRVKASPWNDTIFEVVAISGTGTTAATQPTWNTNIGDETIDNAGANQVVWQASKIGLLKKPIFVALYTAAPGETGGGTETVYSAYTRTPLHPSDTNWSTSVQAGGAGRNDNLISVNFPIPGNGPHVITDMALLSRVTGGNFYMFSPLTDPKTLNLGDPAPSFPVGALDVDIA